MEVLLIIAAKLQTTPVVSLGLQYIYVILLALSGKNNLKMVEFNFCRRSSVISTLREARIER